MKKKILILALCASTLMPASAWGEETTFEAVTEATQIEESEVTAVQDTVIIAEDTDVLDYPGRKEGNVIGEVLAEDEVNRTGTISDAWSRIVFEDGNGKEQTGYVPNSILKGYEEESASDGAVEAGVIHKSSGTGIFADAVDGVTQTGGDQGILVGDVVMASADSSLHPLGTFRITHYCPCSICCGPWANGVTSTGSTAVTNRTIAVDPTVIPYGSKVVIDGQVYIAEDCGGAIKNNRIDIYVGSHAEAEEKGVYETEVYLLEEGRSSEEVENLQEENMDIQEENQGE
ncbi:3D domain-containing protein [Blautia glucerasea]|uniref:3D domain-containing protein n=1 Tax=Blautia glucerasea TaxID=536633 RepID=UPI001D020CCB|nr:3D domain-containing protein [Blautia glucerasea]MCB5387374.1 3D domain-containing protein [Blautia glucerasea]MCB5421649.1 3D domain-containing protein [Blautia luti]